MKKKIFKLLAMVMALTMMFSVNVFAAESQVEVSNVGVQRAYAQPEYSFLKSFEFEETLWGQTHTMQVNVTYTLAYSYADGLWSQIDYVAIHVDSVYIDGSRVTDISSIEYKVYSSSAYRIIKINNSDQVKIGISVDEYGAVDTYAYIL